MRLLSLLLLGVAGCGERRDCPMRIFDCESKTCWQCGETYAVWMGETDHECEWRRP